MRAAILLLNLAIFGLAYYFASFLGLVIAVVACVVCAAAFFALSMAKTEARESKAMKRAMGRNTTLLGRLL
jgi:MFS superfamily sulfate permease-like transporter